RGREDALHEVGRRRERVERDDSELQRPLGIEVVRSEQCAGDQTGALDLAAAADKLAVCAGIVDVPLQCADRTARAVQVEQNVDRFDRKRGGRRRFRRVRDRGRRRRRGRRGPRACNRGLADAAFGVALGVVAIGLAVAVVIDSVRAQLAVAIRIRVDAEGWKLKTRRIVEADGFVRARAAGMRLLVQGDEIGLFEAAAERARDGRNLAARDRNPQRRAVVELGKRHVAIRQGRIDRTIGGSIASVGQNRVRILEIDIRNEALAGPEVGLTEEEPDRRRAAAVSIIATDKKQAHTEAESAVAQQTEPRSHRHLSFERRITVRNARHSSALRRVNYARAAYERQNEDRYTFIRKAYLSIPLVVS